MPSGGCLKNIVILVLAFILVGCAKQSFDIRPNNRTHPEKEETHHFFISGLGQDKTIDAAAVCGSADKVARTETQLTFMNGLVNVLTFGIYTPREARVYCTK
jgi:hypothetical protein